MTFRGIADFLGKFRGLLPKELLVKDLLARALEEVCRIRVAPSDIRIKGTVAYLSLHSTAKSEVFLRRPELLRVVALKSSGRVALTDIR